MAKKEEAKAEAPAGGGKGKLILIIVLVVVVVLGGTLGALFFLGLLKLPGAAAGEGGEAPAAHGAAAHAPVVVARPSGPAQYQPLDPPFVVNFDQDGVLRYVQISLSVMARDKHALDLVKENDPQIRHQLIILFAGQSFADLESPTGKESLQKKVLETIQKILIEESGSPGIEEVYFTNFVMQ
ncbi:flagellar basal body-associated FliL family protein [Plasticicumulans acidivorans]|uniref:Flagellar protein FliL n=1 Tax=Plasticicumulans acidivorans TaxID=886464 RepID=A0A317MWK2_9GAMM|nr:flagellar basal body-associated FliL family protein [Plasticicumulans acidivorans]PWV63276.1 flagellar FliL protein [Plasticicumulans acidivorans]